MPDGRVGGSSTFLSQHHHHKVPDGEKRRRSGSGSFLNLRAQLKESCYTPPEATSIGHQPKVLLPKHTLKPPDVISSLPQEPLSQAPKSPLESSPGPTNTQGRLWAGIRFHNGLQRDENVNITGAAGQAGSPPAHETRSMRGRPGRDLALIGKQPLRIGQRESPVTSQRSPRVKYQPRSRGSSKKEEVMRLVPQEPPKSEPQDPVSRLASPMDLKPGEEDEEEEEIHHKRIIQLKAQKTYLQSPPETPSQQERGGGRGRVEKEEAVSRRVPPTEEAVGEVSQAGGAGVPHHHHRRFRTKGSLSSSSSNNSSHLLTSRHFSSVCCSNKFFLASLLIMMSVLAPAECGNPDAKRLYDDLLSNYNKLVRPVVNVTDVLTVRIKLKLSQLIDVNLKSQIMTTNLWVEQYWYDYKLIWDPREYGGVKMLHVPSDHIWRPDIVLYNNADGNFEVTLSTKATLSYNGLVEWKPPAIYKSSCEIDVEYFPFDEQTCVMKFGSWTYDGFQVDLRHLDELAGTNKVERGVDLSEFYMSVEWDILEVPAVRHEKFYTCCDEPYLDITFNITMRRKTLFYTVNLIIPCMGISFLTVLTFYLPSDSGEKVTLSISILISLHVFFLLVVEIIPPTSLVVPLLGKYLIFAMILVSISICVTVLVLNVHFRSPQTHKMAPWVRRVFIHILPRLLIMKRPQYQVNKHSSLKSVFMEPNRVMIRTCNGNEMRENFYRQAFDEPLYKHNENPNLPYDTPLPRDPREDFSPMTDGPFSTTCRIHGATSIHEDTYILENPDKSPTFRPFQHNLPHCSPEVHRTCWCVNFIAEHTRLKEGSTKVKEDWKYVAMVLDRLFLWIFTLAVLVGTAGIILQAPSLYDDRIPLDKVLSEVYRAHRTTKQH